MIPKKYLNPKIWQLLVTRNMALFHIYFDTEGPLLWTKLYGLNIKIEHLPINRRGHVSIFHSIRSTKKLKNLLVEKVKTNPKFIKNLKQKFHKQGNFLLDVVEKCSQDSITSINKSKNFLKKLFEAYTKLNPALCISTILGKEVQALLKESLKKENYPAQKIDQFISILTFPDQPSPARKEEIALLILTSEIQKQTRKRRLSIKKILKEKWVVQALDKHTENFGWIPVNFIDKPWDKKFFLSQLKNLLKNYNCQKLLRQREKSYNLSLKKRDNLFKRLKLPSQSKRYIKILRETAYLNEYRKSIFCQANLKMRPFLDKIAKRIGLKNWLECCYLLPKEIIEYLDLKKPSSKIKQLVKSRYEKYCLVGISNWKKPQLCDKKELAYVLRNFKLKIPEKRKIKLKILKGFTGSLGKIKGRVKVALVGKDISKVKKDDILVAKMTSVDFIPAMKLASAFVTDEGGITCHAAIVAREMNKPCIIGTKIATKVLKDGDRVEVDADKGIVKKIK